MNTNCNLMTSHSGMDSFLLNCSHVHCVCPFNYCSCSKAVSNYFYSCRCKCKCHRMKNKTTRNILSLNNEITKTPSSNYSKRIFDKEFYQKKYDDYISPNKKIHNTKCSFDDDYLLKRLNNDRANKSNFNTKFMRSSRSMSGIYNTKSPFSIDDKDKDKLFKRSYMGDFYSYNNNAFKKSYYSPSVDKLTKNRLNYDKNYRSLNGERSQDRIRQIKKEPLLNNEVIRRTSFNKYINDNYNDRSNGFNYYNDIKRKVEEGRNNKYIKSYYQKKPKFRNYLNSSEKNKNKEENIINKKRKDVYISLEPKKNKYEQDFNNYEQNNNDIHNNDGNYKDFNTNNINENDIEDNYINKLSTTSNDNEKDRLNYNYGQSNKLSYLKQFEKDLNLIKNNYVDKSDGKNDDKNKNIFNKMKKYNNTNNVSNNDKNIKYNKKNNSFKISRFNLTFYGFKNKNLTLIDIDELNYIKSQLREKNEEVSEYKNKINSLLKEVELYKDEIKKLKLNKNHNIKNLWQKQNRYIYRKKSTDERKTFNENNIFKKDFKYKDLPEKNSQFKKFLKEEEKRDSFINKDKDKDKNQILSKKLNIETDLNISKDTEFLSSYFKKQNPSDKCIFGISSVTKSKSFLCFDYMNKTFSFQDYADFGDFRENYLLSFENKDENSKNNNSIFLVIERNFYIVTGENCDMFYTYNSLKRSINKLCGLGNNHSNGVLISYLNNIICVSGNYNKKVELYNQSKNEWRNLPELQVERSKFSACVLKNKYLFVLFGYNFPTKQYLNTIEYLDLENYTKSSWKYLSYKNEKLLSLYISGTLSINYNDEKIIVVGGNNGKLNKPIECFYQIVISEDFENDKKSYVEEVKRKLKDIEKNKVYLFNKGYNKFLNKDNLYYMAFDDDLRAHIFQVNNMAHDVFNFNE